MKSVSFLSRPRMAIAFAAFSISLSACVSPSAESASASLALAAPTNVALERPARASSTFPSPAGCVDCYGARNAVDKADQVWSRWTAQNASSTSAPQWLEVDLGKVYRLSSILVQSGKENGFGKLVDFKVQTRQVSTIAFRDVATVTANTQASRTLFVNVDARYVRILSQKVSDDGLARIYDLKVMGEIAPTPSPSPSLTPKPSPTPTSSPTPSPTPTPTPTTGKVIPVGTGSGQLIVNSVTELQCGDTLAVKAGSYIGMSFQGLRGCADKPIIITNSGGQVRIDGYVQGNWGMDLNDVKHVVVRSSTPGTYGFRIENRVGRSAVSISSSSEGVDVSGVHVVQVAYGFVVKTDPACNTLAHVSPTLIKSIKIHGNRIESTVWEGMYLGYYNPGDVTLTCDGVTRTVKAQRLSKVEVYDNVLVNTGNDAIKLRLCQDGCDVHDNRISGYGVSRTDDSAWCFGITIGSETYGKIYRNTLDHGYCSAIDIRSDSTNEFLIYGNNVDFAGTLPSGAKGASWAGGILFNVIRANQKFKIYDNVTTRSNGRDVEITNYSALPYTGSVCNSGSNVFVTPGAPTLQPCP